jgi:hypothetical protein
MDQTHLVALLIAAYLLPLSFLAQAWLANRRSPWLASIGAFIALLGFLPLALYVGQDSLYYDIARWGSNPQFVDLAQRWNSDRVMTFYGIVFGLGTVFGPALIGIALWQSRAIPVWAAICLTFSRLSVFVFFFCALSRCNRRRLRRDCAAVDRQHSHRFGSVEGTIQCEPVGEVMPASTSCTIFCVPTTQITLVAP